MSEAIPYADIVILALIAGFILLRLRSVLGHRIGNDEPDFLKSIREQTEQQPVVRASDKARGPKPQPAEEADDYLKSLGDVPQAESLKSIKARDPEFNAGHFLQGAKMAFEMVFDGFAKGDRAPLKMLLSDAIYKEFEAELEARAASDIRSETTLVSVTAKDIVRATLDRNVARLTVAFISEQITVARDKDGRIVEGDPSDVREVADEWTFERDVTAKNPNWTIIDT